VAAGLLLSCVVDDEVAVAFFWRLSKKADELVSMEVNNALGFSACFLPLLVELRGAGCPQTIMDAMGTYLYTRHPVGLAEDSTAREGHIEPRHETSTDLTG
jgi:hypothetical protein